MFLKIIITNTYAYEIIFINLMIIKSPYKFELLIQNLTNLLTIFQSLHIQIKRVSKLNQSFLKI